MPKQVTDREESIDEACAIVLHEGVSALSVRKVAAACGITVGSVYVYFPMKAEPTVAVLKRFSAEMFFEKHCAAREGEGFTPYFRRFHDVLSGAIAAMDVDWFAQMRRFPDSERCVLETARAPMIAHMEQGLRHVLDADDVVVRARLVSTLHPESLHRFTFHSTFASLTRGSDCEVFFVLLDAVFYADAALYADATLCVDPAPSVGATLYIDVETPL